MKTIVIVIAMSLMSGIYAQDKNKKLSFEVDGKCEMCKARIEKAALGVKGVKYAQWDIPSHELALIFDENKTNPMEVKTALVSAGHDTRELKASDEAYEKVHPCCKYREDEEPSDEKH